MSELEDFGGRGGGRLRSTVRWSKGGPGRVGDWDGEIFGDLCETLLGRKGGRTESGKLLMFCEGRGGGGWVEGGSGRTGDDARNAVG